MNQKADIGKKGEDLAVEFLRQKGFLPVARNYRHKKAEVDIIVRKDDWLVFVEVKTRSSAAYGEPEAFVDAKKAQLIFNAAEEFIYTTNWQGHVRFDVVSVKLGREVTIEHFEDAIN